MEINIHNFGLLHKHLISILSTNNHQSEHLPEKVMQYVGMIVESDKHEHMRDDFFDYFCENNGNKIFSLTLEVDPLLAVKTLSMLFINLHSQMWVSYLLCQPFVTGSITHDEVPQDQEWAEYFISLLKSLSIRLNSEHLSLFYNKKFCKFPLLYESLKYYNHPDCMVRTNVMNIILGVMKIKDSRLQTYFGSFPFTSYVLTYCCQIRSRINGFHAYLCKIQEKPDISSPRSIKNHHRSLVKMYFIDMSDYLCYLNDLIELGPKQLAYFTVNAILSYVFLPALKILLSQNSALLLCGALYLCFVLLKTINDQDFQEIMCLFLFGKQIPVQFLVRIKNVDEQLYVPQVYKEDFEASKYFWNKFDYHIEEHCLKIFKDITNFQIPHQNIKPDPQISEQFNRQIKKISKFMGYDILTQQLIQGMNPLSQIACLLGFKQKGSKLQKCGQVDIDKNPIRQMILSNLQKSVESAFSDNLVLTLSSFVIYFSKCQNIKNKVQKFCGVLRPRMDTKNYQDQFNINSLNRIQKICLNMLNNLNAMYQDCKKSDQKMEQNHTKGNKPVFCLSTLKNMLIILDDCIYKQMGEQDQAIYHRSYTRVLQQMKGLMSLKNMREVVQNFQFDYTKVTKEALYHDNTIPYSIFSTLELEKLDTFSDIEIQFLNYFPSNKERVQYFIRSLALTQNAYFRYFQQFGKNTPDLEIYLEKYNRLHCQKYNKIEQTWRVGHSYEMGYRQMVECISQPNMKSKETIKYIIVEEANNFVLVMPSKDQNTVKIVINHPWKYVEMSVDRQNGKRMIVKIQKCLKNPNISLYFQNQTRTSSTLQWMAQLKFNRFQSEQAFILNYLKQCLSKQ